MQARTKEALIGTLIVALGILLYPLILGVLFLPLLARPWQDFKQGFLAGY